MAENKTKIKTEADFLTENSKLKVVQKGKNNPTYQVFHHKQKYIAKK